MYNRIYKFFTESIINYPLKLDSRQQHSPFHALISLTGDIRKDLDKGSIGCGIFVDLQKPFDTVEHDILLAKLEHYGICGMANNWFKSCLFNRKQSALINGHVSSQTSVKYVSLKVQYLGQFCS